MVYTFKEHSKLMLIGIFSGLVTGLFYTLYQELKPQTLSTGDLFVSILFLTIFYALIILFISYPVIRYLSK